MGIILKKSVSNSIVLYGGTALGAILTIFIFPNYLTPNEYGLTRILISYGALASTFGTLGMRSVVVRYFPFFNRENNILNSGLLGMSFYITLAGTLFVSIIFLLAKPWIISSSQSNNTLLVDYYLLIVLLIIARSYYELFTSYLKGLKHTVFSIASHEIIQRVAIIASIIVYALGYINFENFILFFVLSHVLTPFLLFLYLVKLRQWNLKISSTIFRPLLLSSIIRYSLFSTLGGITSVIIGRIDIVMLGAFSNLSDVSVYAVAFYFSSVIGIPQKSIFQIAVPIISSSIKTKDYKNVEIIYKKSAFIQLIMGTFILLLITINTPYILSLLPTNYMAAKNIIIIIGLAKVFDMASGLNGGIIRMSKFYQFDFIANILLIVLSISSNLILIPIYGITGAAIATALTIFIYNLIKIIYLWYQIGIQPFKWKHLVTFLITLSLYILNNNLPTLSNTFMDISYRNIMIIALYFGLLYSFRIMREVADMFLKLKK